MTTRAPYTVAALDKDGYQLAITEDCPSIKVAKTFAHLYLKDSELISAGLYKVEILDMANRCEWDAFAEGR